MKIKDSIRALVEKLFARKRPHPLPVHEIENIPDLFAPWELFPHKDPDIFRCTQGLEEFWSDHIFLPYWSQLFEKERNDLKRRAPSKAWLDWVERVTTQENLLAIRAFHKRHGLPFDYRFIWEISCSPMPGTCSTSRMSADPRADSQGNRVQSPC